ncbi:MAG: serine hydrolase [Longimicrobiales bacterium]|nr:serine hydrolase [Longimicrobiales bacterium]
MATWVAEERIPGAVLLVSRDGDVVLERAYGYARLFGYGRGQYRTAEGIDRLESPRPMTTTTVFDLASVTKVAATTMASMLLVDRDALDLDAPVSRYLPDFSGGGRDAITVRQLLTHSSGLSQWMPIYYHASNPDEAYAYIRDLPLSWTPGAERHYSDIGFMVLGRVVEAAAGQELGAFLQEALYRRLGLDRTGFLPRTGSEGDVGSYAATSHGNPYERRMVHDSAFGYRIEGDPTAWSQWREYTLEGEVNDGNAHHAFRGMAGHAGLFAPARELVRLLHVLENGGTLEGVQYMTPRTLARFLTPHLEGQALGWQLPEYAPEGAFGHTGFTGTFVLVVPNEGLVLALLTNRQNAGVDGETRYPDVGPLQRAVTRAITGAGPDGEGS